MIGRRSFRIRFVRAPAVGTVNLTGSIFLVGVVDIAGVPAVTLSLILAVDPKLIGLFGILDFGFLLLGQTVDLTRVAGLLIPLGLISLGRLRRGDARLKDRTDYVWWDAAHSPTPDNPA